MFTSTMTFDNPVKPIKTKNAPAEKTYFGCVKTTLPNLLIIFSKILGLVIALDL